MDGFNSMSPQQKEALYRALGAKTTVQMAVKDKESCVRFGDPVDICRWDCLVVEGLTSSGDAG